MAIDAVIPARNEEGTVAANVVAALGCRYVREVIVVDDGSTDATAERARTAGAKVLSREGSPGSKAHAMADGVAASDAEAILFVDADCVGLTAAHLDDICRPYVDGRATLSLGAFDYGRLVNPVVLRLPPISGERIVPRWVFESIPPEHLSGYTIEVRINEVICERHLKTVVRTMTGVTHRTKRQKCGWREGLRQTATMYKAIFGLPISGAVRWRTYWFYLQGLTIDP